LVRDPSIAGGGEDQRVGPAGRFVSVANAPVEARLRADPVRVELLVPPDDDPTFEPEVSIVIPALNEEITIGEFVDWCKQGLAKAGVPGEILIVDSSSDQTPAIALQMGARVLRTPKRGLGRAYIDALPYIRGRFVIMGDCDLTYDFREIKDFVDRYHEGYEFVMGSRFKGSIEPGAMPKLHRYFGSPLTTWIMNSIYRSRYSDIHCGMRAVTKNALERIDLRSQSWEYASEMVLKASRLGLRTAEVPVHFYRDREGRLSHLKRSGFLTPWKAGWINLKVMLIYTPESFLLKPGLALFVLGSLLTISLSTGGYTIGPIGFNLHWMLFWMTLAVLGYGCVQTGVLARRLHRLRSSIETPFSAWLTYDRGMIIAAMLVFCGLLLTSPLLWQYTQGGLRLAHVSHPAVTGLFLTMMGFQTFCFTLLLEMVRRSTR
jgi:glycosyltransferase involved in cell wall biosynthesis